MNLTEDERSKTDDKPCTLCTRGALLPHEYEYTSILCGYNVIKRKNKLKKTSRKKINFINTRKYVQHNFFCLCKDLYPISDLKQFFEVLSDLKNKKIKN